MLYLLVPVLFPVQQTLAPQADAGRVAAPSTDLQADRALAPRRYDAWPWRVEVEVGALWSARNDVQIPGDTGTRFSFEDLTGGGAWPVGRVTLDWDASERHGFRLLYAPVRTDGTGTLSKPTNFDGTLFAPGTATGRYQFDTWRFAWRYRFHSTEHWEWRAGLTALVRDASIEVEQGGLSATKDDLGVVPLLNLSGIYRFADGWSALLDVEGAAASQGRAFDVALRVAYDIGDRSRVSLGWRTIEGGADNDEVYTFSWFHALVVSFGYGF